MMREFLVKNFDECKTSSYLSLRKEELYRKSLRTVTAFLEKQ